MRVDVWVRLTEIKSVVAVIGVAAVPTTDSDGGL